MRFRPWRDIARRGTLCIIGGRGHIRLASRRGAEWTALLGSIGVLSLLAFTPLFGTPLLDFPYLLDPQLRARFRDSQDRIRSMALAHETLYRSRDLARFDVAPYIETLSTQLFRSYGVDPQRIGLQTRLDRVSLDIDTAAFKYAFPADQAGEVEVALSADADQRVTLVVRDTGIGFPEGLDFRHTDSLGMQLVCLLTEQLGGTVALARQGGTTFTLTFPASAVSP